MKAVHLRRESSAVRIVLAVLAILFTLFVGPAGAASEPGTVTIVSGDEPYNLDPHDNVMGMTEGQILMKTVVEPLTGINPEDGRIVPVLATSWKQVDPNTWQFVLRKGVKFHDGENFNAEAVLFNIKRLFDSKFDSRLRGKFFSTMKMEGKALDSSTLEIKTGTPEPLLPTLMAFVPMCSPNTPMGKWTRQPIGTGPFKFVKWDAGVQIIYERYDGYWGKQPQARKAVFIWRKDSSVRAAMVLIGEADFAPNISNQDAKRPDLDHSYVDTETTHLRFGGAWEAPLNDRRVRMAVNYAIDRNAIRGSVLSKDVIPAAQVVLPHISGYNPDIKVWPYDPQRAKQLLAEAKKDGVPVDKEILLVGRSAHYPGSDELVEALMSMLKAVGLNVKLKLFETASYNRYRVKPYPTDAGPYIILNKHDNNFGDAVYTFPYLYHCKGGISVTCDKEVDNLIEKAQVAVGDERRNLWRATFKRLRDEIVPDAMLYHMVAYCRVGKRINFIPFIATATEIRLAEITFK